MEGRRDGLMNTSVKFLSNIRLLKQRLFYFRIIAGVAHPFKPFTIYRYLFKYICLLWLVLLLCWPGQGVTATNSAATTETSHTSEAGFLPTLKRLKKKRQRRNNRRKRKRARQKRKRKRIKMKKKKQLLRKAKQPGTNYNPYRARKKRKIRASKGRRSVIRKARRKYR